MIQAEACAECGRSVPDDAPHGLCPACLFDSALDGGPAGFGAFDVDPLAPTREDFLDGLGSDDETDYVPPTTLRAGGETTLDLLDPADRARGNSGSGSPPGRFPDHPGLRPPRPARDGRDGGSSTRPSSGG